MVEAYYNRGMAFLHLREWKNAKKDLKSAENLQKNIVVEQFRADHKSIADFEQEHGVKLPADIAAMLIAP